MNEQPKTSHLKQRILGAIILVAVIVIFVPMILEKHPLQLHSVSDLPNSPEVKAPPLVGAAGFTKQTQMNQVVTPVAQAWVLQLGSFNSKRRAETLANQLRSSGYSSYVYTVTINKQALTRVYVGPELRPERIAQVQKDLKNKLGLKGTIVPFNVLNS